VALPEADSSYMVDLAVMHDYQWVVLARSNVIHAPPEKARAELTPAFVSRAEQLPLPAEAHGRERDGAAGDLGTEPTGEASGVAPAAGGVASAGGPAHMGSEARLRPPGLEFPFASELRFARSGSEARLTRREPAHIPLVIAGSPAMTEPVAGALGALAAAVWLGRDPVDVLRAGNVLVGALAEAGIAVPAVAILDPPGPDVAPPEPAAPYTSSSRAEAQTVSENADGSITVIDRDGNSITYSPVHSAGADGRRTRSAAAVVGVRHGF
jgi:hypothetical protein